MKRLVLAYNPVSGHAAFKKKLDWIIKEFQKRSCIIIPYRTLRHNHHFAEFVRDVEPAGIIAAGGDGTVHEIVNLVVKNDLRLPVGIIGSGTSNDFATYLHINDDYDAYFDAIAAGSTRRVDLGRVGDEYIINVASAGMLTGIAHEVPSRLKNALGKLAYYLRGIGELPKMRSVKFHITADGVTHDAEAYFFLVVNSATVASLKDVASVAEIDDGKLDLLAIQRTSMPQLMRISRDLLAGHNVLGLPSVLHIQAQHFTIQSDTPLESDLDGEAGPMLPMDIETVPGAVEIYCFT
ncbi:MAG: YegS/Rv2252/BmrU family lipid kinase [Selenomonas sp.]|uniref:diacylglycerol/lipid kinase family protein n=1 Tax=Selenomonas sp. TaxID=2053611 RepID=UPI0025EE99E5|nr:YegS/Rv2252/BmrU family lipid kinase [Selenomonas sp.]MCI6231932.1 YegS/Rv2252/BmrU family lipid kinase [Selenomonas sp.]